MLHYWVDGYNLLFRIEKSYLSLKANKQKFLLTLANIAQTFNYSITVVFDGKQKNQIDAHQENLGCLALVYTASEQTADDYILERLQEKKHLSTQIVVSSDLKLLKKVHSLGARTQTIEAFLNQIAKKKQKTKSLSSSLKNQSDSYFEIERLKKIFENKLNQET